MSESICVCREHFNGFKAFLGKVSGRGCWEADDRSSQLSLSITLPSVSHLSLSLSLSDPWVVAGFLILATLFYFLINPAGKLTQPSASRIKNTSAHFLRLCDITRPVREGLSSGFCFGPVLLRAEFLGEGLQHFIELNKNK